MRLPSFRELSQEQDTVYNLPLSQNYLVTGPPGTGKTVIALYRASMYKNSNRKPKILSLSKVLSTYTADAARALKIDSFVATYHSWVFTTYKNHFGKNPPELSRFVYDWMAITPELVMSQLNNRPCLLIDEGQDLPPGFYLAASLMAEQLTVFADENQRITDTQSTFDDIRKNTGITNEYKLTRNYRNTLEIARVAACYYAGMPTGKPDLPTRRGALPVIQKTRSFEDVVNVILRFEQNNSNLEIGIFTKLLSTQTLLFERLKGKTKNAVEFYDNNQTEMPNFGTPGIKLINFKSAKGLEFDAVFIPDLETINMNMANPENKMLFYVLLSRARQQLYLLYSAATKPALLNLIPETLTEFRNTQ